MTCLINEWFRSRFSKLGQESWRVTQKVLSTQNIPCCVFMDTMFWEECMTSMHICLHISLYGYFLIKKSKLLMEGEINIHFFRNTNGWQGWQPLHKKLKTRVTGVTQQTGSNKRLGRKRWQVTLLYTLFFMTYRAKIDKRLIIRGRHPNWRVVSPMHKKKDEKWVSPSLFENFVKLYAF